MSSTYGKRGIDYIELPKNYPYNNFYRILDYGDDFYALILNTNYWKPIENRNGDVVLNKEDHTKKQLWRFVRQGDGSYKIFSVLDNTLIDLENWGTADGTKIQTTIDSDHTAQKWYLIENNGAVSLIPQCSPNGAMDLDGNNSADGTKIHFWTFHGGDAQTFSIYKINSVAEYLSLDIGTNFYALILNTHHWKPIENQDGNVVLSTEDHTKKQLWRFVRQGDGSYKIFSVLDNTLIDLENWGTADGTKIQTTIDSDHTAQKWYLIENNGAVSLIPQCSQNGAMDLDGNNSADGTKIHFWTFHGGDAQTFSIYKINSVAEYLSLDIGTNFYALILNTHHWKPIENQGGNVVLSTEDHSKKQLWRFVRQGDKSYKIFSVLDNTLIDLENWGTADGTKIQTTIDSDHTAQKWYLIENNGAVSLIPQCSQNGAMDLDGNNSADGTKIHFWTFHGGDAQTFSIYKIDNISEYLYIDLSDCTVSLTPTSYTYNGQARKPSVTVTNGSVTLVADTDYTVSYSNNTNAGTATVTITVKGNYTGTTSATFTINKAAATLSFESAAVSKTTKDAAFTNALTKTTDGAVTFKSSNTSVAAVDSSSGLVTVKGAGSATITATAAEGTNYKSGSASYALTVTEGKTDISGCTVTLTPTSYTYNGQARKPSVTVTNGSVTLVADTDYTVSYSNNTNAGIATVTITGKGNYTGTTSATFTINKAAATLSFESPAISKTTKDTAFTNALTKTTDGAVTFKSSNTSVAAVDSSSGLVTVKGAGSATITATAAEGTNYKSGSASYKLTVTESKTDISGCTVTLTPTSYTYNGQVRKPSVTVTNGSVTLVADTDYTVSYSNNTNAGTATVTISGKGNYTGTVSKTFTISAASITGATVTGIVNRTYTGTAQTQSPIVKVGEKTLTSGTDYTLYYSNNMNAGTATVTISGKGNYTGTVSKTFTISAASITGATVSGIVNRTYNGTAQTQSPTVKVGEKTLASGTDYTVSYTNNTNAGTATVTIGGKGNYTGTVSKTFTISAASIASATVTGIVNRTYNGTAQTQSLTVKVGEKTLASGTDYTLSYANNTNAGSATVTITGKNNYTSTITKTFTIAKAAPALKFKSASLSKTGDAAFTNTLTKTTDGAVTFKSSNTSVATVNSTSGKVTIKGAGTATITATAEEGTNYKSGSASYTLTVTANKTDISGCTVTLSATSYTYNGKAKKPSVTVTNGSATLFVDTDYTVSYSNNTNAGTATVTITGKGDYTGTNSATFTINKAAAKLTFEIANISKTTKDAAFTNALTKTTDGNVTFKSSNTGVATVNSTSGLVTIKGAGETTITATSSAGTNYKAGSTSYTLTVTTPAPSGFSDVQDPSHPYYNAIYWAADAGITKGYSDGTFGIDKPCTRGHAVMFLWKMAGSPAPRAAWETPFPDVPTTHPYYKAVLWAQQKGITKGYTSGVNKGKFGIDDTCTRGQIMSFIWRFKGMPEPNAVLKTPFSDVPTTHPYYKAILWGSQNGVTKGYTSGPNAGKFGINDNCTRGQIVKFLYNIRQS